MPSYRLSAEALADIRAIRDYGIATFGLAQALSTISRLKAALNSWDNSPASVRRPMIYGRASIATTTNPTPFSTPSEMTLEISTGVEDADDKHVISLDGVEDGVGFVRVAIEAGA